MIGSDARGLTSGGVTSVVSASCALAADAPAAISTARSNASRPVIRELLRERFGPLPLLRVSVEAFDPAVDPNKRAARAFRAAWPPRIDRRRAPRQNRRSAR